MSQMLGLRKLKRSLLLLCADHELRVVTTTGQQVLSQAQVPRTLLASDQSTLARRTHLVQLQNTARRQLQKVSAISY